MFRFIWIVFLCLITLNAKTIIVDANYPDSCETGDDGYTTIKDALDNASEGDIIKICPGDYEESNLIIDVNNLTIESTTLNPKDVVVYNENSRKGSLLDEIRKEIKKLFEGRVHSIFRTKNWRDNITINSITIQQNKNAKNAFALEIEKGAHFYLKNLIIQSNSKGIYQNDKNIQDSVFDNLQIDSRREAIILESPEHIKLNKIYINSYYSSGIVFDNPKGSIDINNSIIKSKEISIDIGDKKQDYSIENTIIVSTDNDGINGKKANHLTITNCEINASKAAGIYIDNKVNVFTMKDSKILDSKYENIYLKETDKFYFYNNILQNGSYGIYLKKNSSGGEIKNNIIKNESDKGLYLLKNKEWRSFKVINNCFENGKDKNIESRDKNGIFYDADTKIGNFWDDCDGCSVYTIPVIPKEDKYPLESCPISPNPASTPSQFYITQLDRTDKNITTKIVNDEFSLDIKSKENFTGTVCSAVVDENDNNISKWYKNYFDDKNDSKDTDENNPKYIVNKAYPNAKIKIVWLKNSDTNCPLSDETNHSISDNFAIRPDHFIIENIDGNVYSATDFNITFKAVDKNGDEVKDYNETLNNSFIIQYQKLKLNCTKGNFDVNISFRDGRNVTIANYDDIGDLNITIKENNSSSFAKVDNDDSNDSIRLISPYSKVIEVKPYKIEFNTTFSDNNITYMDKDLKTNFVKLITNIKILNAKGDLIPDFNQSCYGKDFNITYITTQNNIPEQFETMYQDKNDTNFDRWDNNWSVLGSFFKNGETNITIVFNIDKNYSKPISIKELNFTKLNIVTPNIVKIEQNETLNKNLLFYYARVLSKDIYTQVEANTKQKLQIIVYDKNQNHLKTLKLIDWYLDQNYTNNDVSVLGNMKDYIYIEDKNVSGFKTDLTKDIYDYNLSVTNTNNNKFVVIHLKTPYYLWYSKYNDYNDSNKSGCISHYCIEYHYQTNSSSASSVGSGDFKGSEVNTTHNVPKIKRGIKIYR